MPVNLRKNPAHAGFDWAAIASADPFRQFEQLLAKNRSLANERFNRPDAFHFALLENGDDRAQRRFVAERHAYAGADSDSFGQSFRHGIVELPMDRPINDDTGVRGLCHEKDWLNLIAQASRSTRFDAEVIRFFFKLILCVLLAVAAGFAYFGFQSSDPIYSLYEWMSPGRFYQYEPLISAVALLNHLDPMLVKVVVWRESW